MAYDKNEDDKSTEEKGGEKMKKKEWHPEYIKALKELKRRMKKGEGLPTIIKEREADRKHFDVSVRTLYRRIKKGTQQKV